MVLADPTPLEDAFGELLRKHGLLGGDGAHAVVELMRADGVASVGTLHRWATECPRLSPALKVELGRFLRLPRIRRLGGFSVVGHLADGGMGEVWLSIGPDGRLAVVKTLLGELSDDAEFLLRFEREAAVTAKLHSPYAVRCLAHGACEDGTMYLVLDYVRGGDLFTLVERAGRLEELEVLRLARQVCLGLQAAYELDLVHRDIKPENILVGLDGAVRLVDFGLARSTHSDRSMLTIAGSTIGTPDYMAPEQILGEGELDIRCDLYALGGVLHVCLSGRPPYKGDPVSMMKHHLESPVPDLCRSGITSRATADLLLALMAKKREQRPVDPAAAVRLIDRVLASQGVGAGPLPQERAALSQPIPRFTLAQAVLEPLAPGQVRPTAQQARPRDSAELLAVRPRAERAGGDWLVLRGDDGTTLHCFARDRLVFGKVRGEPVDICLRLYPREQHEDTNSRISRQHFVLSWDGSTATATIADLDSTNGTLLDGDRLAACTAVPLVKGQRHTLEIPRSIALGLRSINDGDRRNVLITRQANATHIGYALVITAISIGGPGSDMELPGWHGPAGLLIRDGNRWRWRIGTASWHDLGGTAPLPGPRPLWAQTGTFDDYR